VRSGSWEGVPGAMVTFFLILKRENFWDIASSAGMWEPVSLQLDLANPDLSNIVKPTGTIYPRIEKGSFFY
jgi:hypothetical protein